MLAFQHKAMLDAVRCDVTARHHTLVVDLSWVGRGYSRNIQREGAPVLSSFPSESQPGNSIRVEIVAHIQASVIAALSDTILDVSVRVLEKFDPTRRRPVVFLAEGETALQGEPGDASV